MLTFLLALLAAANPALPVIDRPVVDTAGVLSATDVKTLSDRLRAHHDAGGAQLAVVVMPRASLTIEETALALAESWGGGRAGADDGALVLLLTEQRRVRVEVGYGLEGVLPDARVLGILDDAAPALSQQRWAEGLGVIVDALLKKTGPGAAQGRPLVRLASRVPGPFAGLAAFLVVFNLLGVSLAFVLRRRGWPLAVVAALLLLAAALGAGTDGIESAVGAVAALSAFGVTRGALWLMSHPPSAVGIALWFFVAMPLAAPTVLWVADNGAPVEWMKLLMVQAFMGACVGMMVMMVLHMLAGALQKRFPKAARALLAFVTGIMGKDSSGGSGPSSGRSSGGGSSGGGGYRGGGGSFGGGGASRGF